MKIFKTRLILVQAPVLAFLFAVQVLASFVPGNTPAVIPSETSNSLGFKPQFPYPLGKTRINPEAKSGSYYVPKQKNLRYLDYRGYYSIYDTQVNTPLLTIEHLKGSQGNSSALSTSPPRSSRKNDRFKSDSRLVALERIQHESYKDVTHTFSRGHLTPCGDFDERSLQVQTFMTTNIAPQVQETFNDGLWNELETQVRNLADLSSGFTIITGVVHDGKRKLNGRISIPSHFYKIVISEHQGSLGLSSIRAFLMENRRYSKSEMNICDYQVPVKQIEGLTGMNFLISIPEETREEMIGDVGRLDGLCS